MRRWWLPHPTSRWRRLGLWVDDVLHTLVALAFGFLPFLLVAWLACPD